MQKLWWRIGRRRLISVNRDGPLGLKYQSDDQIYSCRNKRQEQEAHEESREVGADCKQAAPAPFAKQRVEDEEQEEQDDEDNQQDG